MSKTTLCNYLDGHRAGRLDALLGINLMVSRAESPAFPGYAEGYRHGMAGVVLRSTP